MGMVPRKPDGFRAHTSAAHSTGSADSEPIRRALDDARPTAARTRIREVSIILMHQDDRMYKWETVASAPISSSQGPSIA